MVPSPFSSGPISMGSMEPPSLDTSVLSSSDVDQPSIGIDGGGGDAFWGIQQPGKLQQQLEGCGELDGGMVDFSQASDAGHRGARAREEAGWMVGGMVSRKRQGADGGGGGGRRKRRRRRLFGQHQASLQLVGVSSCGER